MSTLAISPSTVDLGSAAEIGASLPDEDREEFINGLNERRSDAVAQQKWVWEWSVSLVATQSPEWNQAMDQAANSSTDTVPYTEFLAQLS